MKAPQPSTARHHRPRAEIARSKALCLELYKDARGPAPSAPTKSEDGDVPLDFGRRVQPTSPLQPARNSTSDLPTSPGTRATHCPCPRSTLSNAPTPLSPQALRIDSACRHSTAEQTVLRETTNGSAPHCPPPRPRLPDIGSLPRSTWVYAMAMPPQPDHTTT